MCRASYKKLRDAAIAIQVRFLTTTLFNNINKLRLEQLQTDLPTEVV